MAATKSGDDSDPTAEKAHAAFLEDYRARRVSLSVNRKAALGKCVYGLVPGASILFFNLISCAGCAVFLVPLAVFWYFGFWFALLPFLVFGLVYKFGQQMACYFVKEAVLKDAVFWEQQIMEKVIKVIPYVGR